VQYIRMFWIQIWSITFALTALPELITGAQTISQVYVTLTPTSIFSQKRAKFGQFTHHVSYMQ